MIATKEGPVQLQQGRGENRSAQAVPIIKTDAEGQYRLPRLDVPFKLAAAHELGFARMNSEQLKKSNEVRLLPWDRVEGQVVTGSQPAVGTKVVMSSDDSIGAFWTYEDAIDGQGQPTRNPVWSVVRLNDGGYQAITDKEGRFVFERVPPLDMTLRDVVGTSMAHTVYFKVEPGQTTKLAVGGTGRPVIGRVVIPEIPGGRSDEPIDLGDLDLKLTTLLDVGQSAPSLEFETLDGQWHTLEDCRGKYVLIDFWAAWSSRRTRGERARPFAKQGLPPPEVLAFLPARLAVGTTRRGNPSYGFW